MFREQLTDLFRQLRAARAEVAELRARLDAAQRALTGSVDGDVSR